MTEQERFEAWYIQNHHDGDIHPNQQLLEWDEKGEFYFATSVNDLWEAWQAAQQKEGFVLVPIEPTDEVLDRAVAFALQVGLSSDYRWTDYMRDLYARFLNLPDSKQQHRRMMNEHGK